MANDIYALGFNFMEAPVGTPDSTDFEIFFDVRTRKFCRKAIPGSTATGFIATATTNQIVLGTTNTTTINSVAPAASRVYTIRDVGAAATFQMTAGALTLANTAITAFATGGQSSAVALTAGINRINTCATAGDSVKLPAALAGMVVHVSNYGAAYANVFPATGEIIDALAANTEISLPTGRRITFTCAVAGSWTSTAIAPPPVKYSTGTTTTTFAAGQCSGAGHVIYANTQATPGSIAFRTAAQMFADDPYARVGGTYLLTISNAQGTGTLTVTGGATGITLTGTATIAINTSRTYAVTYTSASALVIQNVNINTFS